MNIADALKILGLEKNASTSQLKSAYKKLALEFHPDRNPGDPEAEKRFKQIVIAHEILQNPKRPDPRGAPRAKKSTQPRNEYEEKWEDIFSHIFRNARESGDAEKSAPRDLYAQIEVTLEELLGDTAKEISVSRRVCCASCGGRGAASDARMSACPACKGAGEVRYNQGLAELRIPCSACAGSGEYTGEACGPAEGRAARPGERACGWRFPPRPGRARKSESGARAMRARARRETSSSRCAQNPTRYSRERATTSSSTCR